MGDARQRPEADGMLFVEGDRCVLRFERDFAYPIDDVWAALTEPGELMHWWGEAQVDLVKGGRFIMRWLNTDDAGNRAVMNGTITALEPPYLLEITGDIHGVLRFELRPLNGSTLLSFSSTLQLPAEYRTKALAGWHFHLDALATLLAGGSTDMLRLPGWQRIHQRYLEHIAPPPTDEAIRALYFQLLGAWNNRSGLAFAACFADDGEAIGFDGSQHRGRSRIGSEMQEIFDKHPTASYVAKVKRVRLLGRQAAVLHAIAGLVPPGHADIKPEVNAVQALTAEERDGKWRIVLFQNTPAQFHGRPELVESMTDELRQVLHSPR